MAQQLTPQRKRFCEEFLVDLDAGAAAQRAGYSLINKRAASVTGNRLRSYPCVQEEISRLQRERGARVEITADFVLRELEKVARQEDVAQGTKVRALELLGKHLGMFVERHEVKVTDLTPEKRAARVAALLAKGAK